MSSARARVGACREFLSEELAPVPSINGIVGRGAGDVECRICLLFRRAPTLLQGPFEICLAAGDRLEISPAAQLLREVVLLHPSPVRVRVLVPLTGPRAARRGRMRIAQMSGHPNKSD